MKKYVFSILTSLVIFCGTTLALKLGVTAGPHVDIANQVKAIAAKQGLNVEVIEFNDFIMPNEALASKDIDVNSMQHELYLNEQIKSRGYKFKALAKTVVMPLGVYSTKINKLDNLRNGAKISIPNDPSNEGRALKLLAKNGLIELKDVPNPTILDIKSNQKNVSLIPMEAPLLPNSLADVDASVINTDWVLQAKMDPNSSIVHEDKDCPYANVIVVREDDETKTDLLKLVNIYHSPEIRSFIEKTFHGAVIPAW
jgi:D-methionine transport system substrate-binding protein